MPGLSDFRQQYPQYSDMSDTALADALYTKYYSDMPRADFNFKLGLSDAPAQPAWDGSITIPLPGGRSFKPSIIDLAKAAWEGIKAPGAALKGEFDVQPEVPGQISEADIERQRMATEREMASAGKLAGTLILGQAPGGIFGAPPGSLASGIARPGQARPGILPSAQVPPAAGAPPVPGGLPPAPPPVPPASPSQIVETASRLDVPIPRYLVDESRMTQGMAAGLQNIPGAGDKIAKAAEQTTKALGIAADRVREGYGTGSPAVAGSYAKDALADWMTTGSKAVADRVYNAVDDLVRPEITTELKSTLNAAQTILDRRAASKIPGKSVAVDTVLEAATTPGGLNYQGIKGLRSFVGEMTPEELISQGLKASEVKQLYGALTNDLRMSVLNGGGPQALTAFNKANRIFENISSRREALQKIVGVKGDAAPEAVFARLTAMAGSKSSADISRLTQARKAMGPEAWNEVAAAAVARLGRDPQGEFSVQRFLTAHGNLSPSGRTLLFSTTGRDNLARSLEDIAFVTRQIEDKLKQFSNPSGTARSLVSSGLVMDAIRNPIKALATQVGGRRMAEVLSEPATARAAADWAKAYRDAVVAPSLGKSKAVRDAAEQLAGLITRQTGGNPQLLAAQLQFNALGGSGSPPTATTH